MGSPLKSLVMLFMISYAALNELANWVVVVSCAEY